jgi:multicomponent Na+:H+ antiporter subunit D
MIESLPVLLIALPIVAAATVLVAGQFDHRVGWPLTLLAMVGQVALAGWLAVSVVTEGRVDYAVGNFEIPYGIELVVDGLSATVVLLVAAVSLAVLAYVRRAGPHSVGFFVMYLLLVTGLTGMTVTGDVFNLYVFLEITGLAGYALVATGEGGRAAVSALKYLIVGTIGASLYLLGVGYALVSTGTLNMADLAATFGTAAAPYDSTLVVTAFALMVAGLAVKVALYPLHTWQPGAYANAPDSVSVFISALVSTVSAYALARVVFSVFTVDFFDAVPLAQDALVTIAAVSVVLGSALAVMQTDVQRMLAYSSVSQFGLIVAAVGIATPLAVVGAVIHLVGHAVMKGGLFAATGIVRRRTGARHVDDYAGLSDRAPLTAACFALLALAMVGVPPAVGFVGKWYIVVGAFEAERWVVAAVLLVSTLLTLAYFARLVERMYFREATADPAGEAAMADGGDATVSAGMLALVVGATVAAIALGPLGPPIESALQPTLEVLLSP